MPIHFKIVSFPKYLIPNLSQFLFFPIQIFFLPFEEATRDCKFCVIVDLIELKSVNAVCEEFWSVWFGNRNLEHVLWLAITEMKFSPILRKPFRNTSKCSNVCVKVICFAEEKDSFVELALDLSREPQETGFVSKITVNKFEVVPVYLFC